MAVSHLKALFAAREGNRLEQIANTAQKKWQTFLGGGVPGGENATIGSPPGVCS